MNEAVAASGIAPLSCPDLIGRTAPLAALHHLLATVQDGQGQTVLLAGEAGIGKSRLVAEATVAAQAQGFVVLQGACFPQDSACPYAPVLDLLRSGLSPAMLAALAPPTAPLARALFPLLPDLFPWAADQPPLPALDPAQEQLRLFAALAQSLGRLAAQQPLLLVFEDLHWSDDTSLAFLLTLARRSTALPLLLLLTYRTDEPRPPALWLAQLARDHHASEITLARLTRAEVSAMLRALFGTIGLPPPALLASIYDLTDGNPFFIEEMLVSLGATGSWPPADPRRTDPALDTLPVPRSIHGLLRQRFAPLSAAARHVLALAAIVGRSFDQPLLANLVGWDPLRLLAALKEGIAAHLIIETPGGGFAFRHALTRQALASDLLAHEHQHLHAQVAAMLERTARPLPASLLADLAYHCYEAGQWDLARTYAVQAGTHAQALHDPRIALVQWNRAFAAASRLGQPAEAVWYRARGDAHALLGDFAAAQADYVMTQTLARAAGDDRAAWQALIDLGQLWTGRDYTQAGTFFTQARDLAETLADPTPYAHSLNHLANWYLNTGQETTGLPLHRAALPIFQAAYDQLGTADTLDRLGMAYSLAGDLPQAVAWFDQAVRARRDLADGPGLIHSLQGRGVFASPLCAETTAAALHSRAACADDAEEALQLARQIGALAGEALAGIGAAGVYLSFGDAGRALAHAQAAWTVASDIGHQQWMTGAAFALGQIYWTLRLPDRAVAHLEAALPLAQALGSAWWIGNIRAYLALAYLHQGDRERAAATLTPVLAPDQPPRTMPERRVAWAWSEWALAQGQPDLALQRVEQLLATAPNTAPAQAIPTLLRVQGEALLALRRAGAAIRALAAAREAAQAQEAQPLLWPIHAALARAQQRAHHAAPAVEALDAARRGIATLAATLDDPPLRDEFTRAAQATLPRGLQVTARRVAAARFGGLTTREREVATQIAQGHSNRAIAAALVVGERTIETHVGHILTKLGFAARAQIAVWAVENGLAAPS